MEISSSDLIDLLIRRLSSEAGAEACHHLESLIKEPDLERWSDHLTRAQEAQRVLIRDVSYCHPSIKQVQRTIRNHAPANAADLAALLRDQLKSISEHVRGGNTDLWRQFWNIDSCGRPKKGRPEGSCRDVVLEALQHRLPNGIDATREGQYAAERRSDIRVAFGGFNVPIEIKKNSHRRLWSALRTQLIDRYTTDPDTSGYGIYLVLWFGSDDTTPPPDAARPSDARELLHLLQGRLTPDERHKISVIVIDVTRPGG